MIIVAGHLIVDPEQRATYLEACVAIVEQARQTPGCSDMAISADLADRSRVNIFERWQSRDALEQFRDSGPEFELFSMIQAASVEEYDVTSGQQPGGSEA